MNTIENHQRLGITQPPSEVQETRQIDNVLGYYYDFQKDFEEGDYSKPHTGFIIPDDCLGRAIYLKHNQAIYRIFFCNQASYKEIIETLKFN